VRNDDPGRCVICTAVQTADEEQNIPAAVVKQRAKKRWSLLRRKVGLVYWHHNCGPDFATNIQTSSAPHAAQHSGKAY